MTYKNLYHNKELRKINRLHASMDCNLPKLVRHDIQNFIDKVTQEGYIFRRIPSVTLLPIDKERIQLDKIKRANIFNIVRAHLVGLSKDAENEKRSS